MHFLASPGTLLLLSSAVTLFLYKTYSTSQGTEQKQLETTDVARDDEEIEDSVVEGAAVTPEVTEFKVQHTPRKLAKNHEAILNRKYLDLKRWAAICRPQYKYACGMSSLVGVFNYLYTTIGNGDLPPVTQEEALKILGFYEPFGEIRFGPFTGNQTIMKWFHKLVKHFGVKGKASYLWKAHGTGKTIGINADVALEKLKKGLKDPNCAFIYHCYNHYMVPMGYEESPLDQQEVYTQDISIEDSNTYIIIGDSSKTNIPIHCVNWRDIAKDISLQLPNYLNIRHLEKGVMQKKTKNPGNNLHCLMIFRKDVTEEEMMFQNEDTWDVSQTTNKTKKKKK